MTTVEAQLIFSSGLFVSGILLMTMHLFIRRVAQTSYDDVQMHHRRYHGRMYLLYAMLLILAGIVLLLLRMN